MSLNSRSRITLVTVGALLAGLLFATSARAQAPVCIDQDPNSALCVGVVFNANVQITNLHPAVTHVQLYCYLTGLHAGSGQVGVSKPIVNRGYTGPLTNWVGFFKTDLADPAARTASAKCDLMLIKAGNTPAQRSLLAVASAAQPQLLADDNWAVVASGSTITWTQSVTFPNATP